MFNFRKVSILAALVLMFTATQSFAQPKQGADGKRPPRGERGAGARHGDHERGNLLQRMTEELKLSDEQVTKIGAILEAQRNERRDRAAAREATMKGQGEEIRKQIEAARKAGDKEKATQLRQQMRELMGGDAAGEPDIRKVQQEIEKLLTDEQKTKFRAMRRQMELEGGMGGEIGFMRAVVGRLELTAEQRSQIEKLFGAFRAETEGKDGDAAAMHQRAQKLRTDVMSILTPEQKQQVEKGMKAGPRAETRRGEAGKGPRPAGKSGKGGKGKPSGQPKN